MKSFLTEKDYENTLLDLFEQMGYRRTSGGDVERDCSCPLYDEELEGAVRYLNAGLSEEALSEALRKVRHVEGGSLEWRNEVFSDWLVGGVSASYRDNDQMRTALVKLVDFEHTERNSFVVANQWTVTGEEARRADIVVFVNGIPLVVMELKSPANDMVGVHDAYNQLRGYMRVIGELFVYNAFCVVSDMAVSKAGTISSSEDRFMEWKSMAGEYTEAPHVSYETFFRGIFGKSRLLDIVKNFICFCVNGEERTKIMAGYHQYFAVRKAVASTLKAAAEGGDGKGGVFWHTQGAGKSLSMVFLAHLLEEAMQSPTIVVLTDRNDLDNQLYAQFAKCAAFLRQSPRQAESREELRQLLQGRQANGIFFTTMQKFTEAAEPLSERRNIVVMADEAHRSQYGLAEYYKNKRLIVGSARRVRESLPGATYIGFTGTPISTNDKSTREVFGDYIDIYDMTQAVVDGATVPVYYESRVMKLKLDEVVLRQIDALYDDAAQELDESVIAQSKRKMAQMEAILGNGETLDTLVADIIEHYEDSREQHLTGKAMIVAYSRLIAFKIYRKILSLRPAWQDKVALVMTGSPKDRESDEWKSLVLTADEWQKIETTKAGREQIALKFKDNKSPLKIAIVVDMWLTGFDVPSLATMYVYKPMVGHNLMQAIARVNRVFRDKAGGLVVDYVGIARALKDAMREYTGRDRNSFSEMNIANTAYKTFLEKLSVCRALLKGSSLPDFSAQERVKEQSIAHLQDASDFLLRQGNQEVRKDFLKQALMLHQALSLCSSIAKREERMEAAFYEAVRGYLVKLSMIGGGKRIPTRELNERVAALLEQSVLSSGVENLAETKTSLSLFDPVYLEQIAKLKHKNLALEILRRLLAQQVRVYQHTSIAQADLFSARLQGFMNAYINGLISNTQVIEELLKMAEEIRRSEQEGEELGLTTEEKAFYDALCKPQAVRDFYENDELIAITRELTRALHKNRTIDWQLKESARAAMRMMIKRLLKKHRYPPKGEEEALDTVMRQCELWADSEEVMQEGEYVLGKPVGLQVASGNL